MKTNGIYLFGIVFIMLFLLKPALSESPPKILPGSEQVIILSQIDKNPADLISIHVRHSLFSRNAVKSSSFPITYQTDSIIYYSGLSLNNRETFSYDRDGNLLTYFKEIRGTSGWTNYELNTFTYDETGNLLTEFKQTWKDFFWEASYLLTYTYDNQGNMLTYLIQKWESGRWTNYNFYIYTYNSYGNILSCLEQIWGSEEWENSCFSTNHYNNQGNLDYSLRVVWDGSLWVNSSQNQNTFNSKGHVVTSLFELWSGSEWSGTELYTYNYDDRENLLSHLIQYNFNDVWHNFRLCTYTYNENNNNLTYFEQVWENEEWANYSLTTRTFDEEGNMLTELNQEWLNTWNYISNSVFTYDENNNCTSTTWFYWSGDSWENSIKVEYEYIDGLVRGTGYNWDGTGWVNGDAMLDMRINHDGNAQLFCEWWGSMAEVYYSALYTSTPEQDNSDLAAFSIYPNPANQVLHINSDLDETVPTTINVYDLSGKATESVFLGSISPALQPIELNTGNMSPGTYIIEIKTGQQSCVQKFTVLR